MGHGIMEVPKAYKPLGAPKVVIELAKRVMGGIDLDPYSTEEFAHHEDATAFYHRSAHRRPWRAPGTRKRALLAAGGTRVTEARELLLRLLKGWDSGDIHEAIAWVQASEILTSQPWLWDAPLHIVMPFGRLSPTVLDETGRFRSHKPSTWSFIAYFPPPEPRAAVSGVEALLAEVQNLGIGRVISPSNRKSTWEDAYKRKYNRAFDFEPEEIDVD